MTTQNKKYVEVDVKPYQPYGIPLLLFLGGIGAIALIVVAIYEWVL
jgi:hypothetical protein